MTRRVVAGLVLVAVATLAFAGADGSIGVCTRKEEFAKRQEAMDVKVLAVTSAKDESKRKSLAVALAPLAETDIECLIRYREPALAPAFVEIVAKSKKWFTRTRAIYALKMVGDASVVPALATALDDKDGMVREAAANALGHLGGDAAKAALEKRQAAETDPYVKATIDAAVATTSGRPYERSDGKQWQESLVGPQGAKRVEWAWVQKGSPSFNDYKADAVDLEPATKFVYPVQRYKEDLFAGPAPRNSFGGSSGHAAEDHAWYREGSSYYAVADGVVRMVQGAGGDFGFIPVIEFRLADGRYVCAVYGHSAFDVTVHAGDRVVAGQRIATERLSCAVENGGYGSHLHFGLGDGPFRRPSKVAAGDVIEFDADGKKVKGPVLRLVYAKEGKGSHGWPLCAAVVKAPDGTEREIVFPEEDLQRELTWFQAYIKDCRGWVNPQTWLPALVETKAPPPAGK